MLLMLIKLSSPLKCLFHWCASPWLPGVVDSRRDCVGSGRIFSFISLKSAAFLFQRVTPVLLLNEGAGYCEAANWVWLPALLLNCFYCFIYKSILVYNSILLYVYNCIMLVCNSIIPYTCISFYDNLFMSNVFLHIYVDACIYVQVCASIYVYTHTHICVFTVSLKHLVGWLWMPVVCCGDHHPPLCAYEGCSGRQSNNGEEKYCAEPCVSRLQTDRMGPVFPDKPF